jgi:hypothetical protein
MTQQIVLKAPNWKSVGEFIIDTVILIVVFNIAGSFFLEEGKPLDEQLTGLFMTIGCTGIALKYVLSTKILK